MYAERPSAPTSCKAVHLSWDPAATFGASQTYIQNTFIVESDETEDSCTARETTTAQNPMMKRAGRSHTERPANQEAYQTETHIQRGETQADDLTLSGQPAQDDL
jgi:hypothetical protein